MNSKNLSILLTLVCLTLLHLPAQARVKVQNSVTVDAKMESVWQALMEYQKEEKQFHKKLVSSKHDKVNIKEEFIRVPVVGSASIDYIEENHPGQKRIDYKLTKSKILTKFEGTWTLVENQKGSGVIVTLTTDIDTWVPAPFKNRILKNATKKGMKKRLAFIKKQAEHSTN